MAPFLDIWNVVEGLLEAMGVSQEKIDIFYVIICSFHFIRHDSISYYFIKYLRLNFIKWLRLNLYVILLHRIL